jgi:ribose transport system ATP-binding protein
MFISGRVPRRAGLVNLRAARRRTEQIFDELAIANIDPRTPVRTLPLPQQQLLEIAKVLARKPRILILDEATSSLPRQDVLWLSEIVHRLREEGTAVLLISHRLNEAFEFADRVTVFRNGKEVRTGLIGEFDESTVVEAMLGRQLELESGIRPADPSPEVRLHVSELSVRNQLRPTSFQVRRGEIFGLAGLQGQGQDVLLRALYGSVRHDGEIRIDGHEVTVRSPRQAIRSGLALVPEDRRTQGLAPYMSIRENLTLPSLKRHLRLGTIISPAREEAFAYHLARQFSLRADSLEDDVASLSGGNQQKVLLTKMLSLDARVLLFSDVTRGVDVGTKADIFGLMRSLAADGTSIVFYSSDSVELIHMCHRVAVIFDHGIACVLEGSEITERNLVQAAVTGRLPTEEVAS